jgi:hypothetical protein
MSRPLAAALGVVAISAFLSAPAAAQTSARSAPQQNVLVNMNRMTPHQTRVDVFTIASPQSVRINAVGADERFPRHGKLSFLEKAFGSFQSSPSDGAWRGNAWIIDAATRKVVWELRFAQTTRESSGLRAFDGQVYLKPGTYEAYYGAYSAFNTTVSFNDNKSEHTADEIRAHTKYDDDGVSKKFLFTVRGNGRALPATTYIENVDVLRRNAFVSLTGVRAGQTRTAGFALDRPTRVDIYAIGEVRSDEAFDYGWIVNADTHEKIWGLDYGATRPAGGAPKNREARTSITLPAGRYAAIFTMDDSHDVSDWNSAPPHDPGMWGMTLRAADAADRAHIRTFTYDPKPKDAIVAITGVGDKQLETAGFTLKKPARVRVFAVGEGAASGMDDYAWITSASSHQSIWKMSYGSTKYAGGDHKNRFANEVLDLPAGSYIVSYRTDDSHAAGDWNSAAPIEGDMWGVTVMPASAADRAAVAPYDPASADGDVIARLTNMEDDEDARSTFRIDRPTNVHIYAVGEGRDDEMFDHGFIEERGTKRVVWEMKYRATTHAGGSRKNRAYDGTVLLPPGDYVLRWVSDDSHSADGWNEAPPDDPAHWGITLSQAKR